MANTNVDNLTFGVYLDDKDFKTKAQQLEETARRLNVSMSNLLEITQKVYNKSGASGATKEMARMAEYQDRITRAALRTEEAQRRAAEHNRKSNAAIQEGNRHLSRRVGILQQIGNQMSGIFSIYAAERLVRNMAEITGEFEKQKMAMRAILRDADGADALYDKLKGLALDSPFTFKELSTYGKQLAAFSIPLNEIYDTTKMLADVSAGLGVDMSRIILAYGQVRSAAFLRGQEVRQFTEAGIPILQMLADQFSEMENRAVSAGEVFDKISTRQVPFEMVKQAFVDMTSAGGQFYNMQEVLVETLSGKIGKLKDAWEQALAAFGDKTSGVIKGKLDFVTNLLQDYEQLERILLLLISTYGAYKAAVIIATTVQKTNALSVVGLGKAYSGMSAAIVLAQKKLNALKNVSAWSIGLWGAMALAVMGVVSAIVLLANKTNDVQKMNKAVADATAKMNSEFAAEDYELQRLIRNIKNAKQGTNEYDIAKKQLYSRFGSYISQLQEEGKWVDNLADNYTALKDAIFEAQQARAAENASKKVEDTFSSATHSLYNEAKRVAKTLSGAEFADLWAVIRGEINLDDAELPSGWLNKVYSTNGREVTAYRDLVNSLIARYEATKEAYDKAMKDIEIEFGKRRGTKSDDFVGPILADWGIGWRKTAREVLSKNLYGAAKSELWAPDNMEATEYIDFLRKRFAANKKALTDYGTALSKAEKETIKQEQSAMDAIFKAFGTSADVSNKNGSNSSNNPFQPLIDGFSRFMEKYKTFQTLVGAGVKESSATSLAFGLGYSGNTDPLKEVQDALSKALGGNAPTLNFELGSKTIGDQLREVITDETTLKNLSGIISQAEGLRNDKIQERLKFYQDIAKYVDKDQETLEKIAELEKLRAKVDADTDITDEKKKEVLAGIDTELSKLRDTLKEIDALKLTPLWRIFEIMKDNANIPGITDDFKEIAEAFGLIEKYGKRNLSNGRLKSMTLSGNMITDNKDKGLFARWFGDKATVSATAEELRNVKKAIDDINNATDTNNRAWGLGGMVEGLAQMMSARVNMKRAYSEKDTEGYNKALQEYSNGSVKTTEGANEMVKAIDQLGDALSSFGGKFKSFGTALKSISSSFGNTVSAISDAKAGKGKAGLWAAAIQGTLDLVSMIGEQIAKNKEYQEEWKSTIAECNHELTMMNLEALEYKQSNIFGIENPYKKATDGLSLYTAAMKEMYDVASELEKKGKVQTGTEKVTSGENVAKGMGIGAGVGAAIGSIINLGLGTLIGTIAGTALGSIAGGFAREEVAIFASLKSKYGEIYDKDTFELNPKILADYNKLNDETKALVDNWKEIQDEAKEAKDAMEDVFTELAGDLGKSLSDSLEEAFRNDNLYSAVDEFHDKVTSTIEDIMQQLIFSAAFQDLFEELQSRFEKSFSLDGDFDLTDDIEWFDKEYQKRLELYNKGMEQTQAAWQKEGYYLWTNNNGDNTLSNNIKGVTEDTAQLLASYINAIRADVSMGRVQRDKILEAVERLSGSVTPNLSDYLNTIQAHTADIAQSNRDILSRIDQVMSSEEGGAIKVLTL